MMNPSYNGVVKVGKTARDPEERAKELSSATGVATPFVVVYKRLFRNCHLAERLAHEILTERGYRVNNNREFFSASIPDAIDIIIQLPDSDDEVDFASFDDNDYENKNTGSDSLGEEYFNMAEDYYHGNNDKFEDHDMALFYYEKSASLGYDSAYEKLGEICMEKGNSKKAIRYYQKAVDAGCSVCYAKLGKIYMDEDSDSYNYRNSILAWSKYLEYIDRSILNLYSTGKEFVVSYIGFDLFSYFSRYLFKNTIPDEHKAIISKNKKCLIETLNNLADYLEKYTDSQNLMYLRLKNNILPFLHKFDKDKQIVQSVLNYTFDLTEAHNYLFEKGDTKEYIYKAFDIYKTCLNNKDILGNAYLGICSYKLGNSSSANFHWKCFYNDVYDLLMKGNLPVVNETRKHHILEAYYQIFYIATKNEDESLIHKFYYLSAWQLGFQQFLVDKLTLFTEKILDEVSNLNSANSSTIDSIIIEQEILSNITKRAQEIITECQGDDWERPYRL